MNNNSEMDEQLAGVDRELSPDAGDLETSAIDADDPAECMTESGVPESKRRDGDSRLPPADDGRFANYLSTSFQPARPLRHERRIQRNKAIVMAVFVLLVLYLLVSRFFL